MRSTLHLKRALAISVVALLLTVMSSAGRPDVDKIEWANAGLWKCGRSLSIAAFPINGEFKGKLPKEDYIKMFSEKLAAGFREKNIFDRVEVLEQGKAPTTDLIVEGEFKTLTTGSRAARFWVGFGAGRSKCEVEARCYRSSDHSLVFTVEHARISAEGLKADEVQENIEEVSDDMVAVLSEQKPGCNDPNVITTVASPDPGQKPVPSPKSPSPEADTARPSQEKPGP